MHYLAGTDSVHTTAAICDYLGARATADDRVTVIAVAPSDAPDARRDAEEALTVAPVRLGHVERVETAVRTGDPASELREVADSESVDEIVVGPTAGQPDAADGPGSTLRALLADPDRPVVVVPFPPF